MLAVTMTVHPILMHLDIEIPNKFCIRYVDFRKLCGDLRKIKWHGIRSYRYQLYKCNKLLVL